MEKLYKIYALVDSAKPDYYKYIGLTSQKIEARLKGHLKRSMKSKNSWHVYNWINSILDENRKPLIILIEDNISQDLIFEREKYWIDFCKKSGFKITNLTNGGEGCFGYKHLQETKIKISKSLKGKPTWNKGRRDLPKASRETKNKMSLKKQKKIKQYNIDNKFIREFNSIEEAIKLTGLSYYRIINNKTEYVWKYE